MRTYPKGTRFDSSNYNPMHMWVCGIQLAAINFQYPSLEMHLNQGFFRINGGCGYVLKPLVMRREDPGGTGEKGASRAPYNPLMGVPHPEVPPLQLEIEVIWFSVPLYLCTSFSTRARAGGWGLGLGLGLGLEPIVLA